MIQTLCILGRQPALGLAELESLYGATNLRPIASYAALLNLEPKDIDFSRLGGTVKFCKVLTILETTEWSKLQKFLEDNVVPHATDLPEGKMKLGLSVYGLNPGVKQINYTALSLKKIIKKSGRSIRVIPNNESALNSAQVLHNQLTSALGWELIFVRDGNKTILAQNIAEQNIEAYAKRDQGRPMRDARVGMLPPKLAQTILNLAVGPAEPAGDVCGPHEPKHKTVLDPFCGTGVMLQEALLQGYDAYGTDLEPRMIEYSDENMTWLGKNFAIPEVSWRTEVGDAMQTAWSQKFEVVAGETYLGRALSSSPSDNDLKEIITDCNYIHKKFLQNLAPQIESGFRLCLAVPAWSVRGTIKHLPLLDSLTDIGYNRLSFVHVDNKDLVYHRDGQIVARELVVLQKK